MSTCATETQTPEPLEEYTTMKDIYKRSERCERYDRFPPAKEKEVERCRAHLEGEVPVPRQETWQQKIVFFFFFRVSRNASTCAGLAISKISETGVFNTFRLENCYFCRQPNIFEWLPDSLQKPLEEFPVFWPVPVQTIGPFIKFDQTECITGI